MMNSDVDENDASLIQLREKLTEETQLDRIERKLDELVNILGSLQMTAADAMAELSNSPLAKMLGIRK